MAIPLTAYTAVAATNTTHNNSTQKNTTAILDAIGQQEAQFGDVQGVVTDQGNDDASVMDTYGHGDCWADASWLYDHLTAAGIQARIMGYENDGYGIGYRHAWVEINIGNGWQMWNYSGYNSQHCGDVGTGTPTVIIGPDNPNPNIEKTGY